MFTKQFDIRKYQSPEEKKFEKKLVFQDLFILFLVLSLLVYILFFYKNIPNKGVDITTLFVSFILLLIWFITRKDLKKEFKEKNNNLKE